MSTRTRAQSAFRPATLSVLVATGLLGAATLAGAAREAPPGTSADPSVVPVAAPAEPALAADRDAGARAPDRRFSTYFGGRFWDEATDVDADAQGNTLFTGFTLSPDLRVRRPAQGSFHDLSDAFVTKLSKDGRTVLWSTYLGGRDVDIADAMAVDRSGNVYVTGMTASPDFPTTGGTVQRTIRGHGCQGVPCHDAFVTKLSPSGRILYSTFFGGTANEEGVSVAVDARGNAYVSGNTDSSDLPTRSAVQSRFQSPPCPNDLPCPYDVFVAKLSSNGRSLMFSTYLGGHAGETSGGVAVDKQNRTYVTGTTRSADFPHTRTIGSPMTVRRCGPPPGQPCQNAFVTRLRERGDRIDYSTLIGGSKNEQGSGVAVDSSGRAVVTGSTQSADFPTRRAQQAHLDNAACLASEQCTDGFVSKLDASGRNLVYSTYLGGRAHDQGLTVAVDRAGNAFVGGSTTSRDFRTRRAVQPKFGGYIDGFASSLSPDGALRWSTFVGGELADRVEGIAAGDDKVVRMAGRTLSHRFPTKQPVQPSLRDDDYDAIVAAIRSD